jgi:hypothetical protein
MKNFATLALLFLPACFAQKYTDKGELILPPDYREWVFLSSGLGMTYAQEQTANNPPFENVFVNPGAYKKLLATGVWPDKTVMILEVRASESKLSINKNGRVQTKMLAREAHVKDNAKGGWAFYGFQGDAGPGTLFPRSADCYSCHEQNGAVDTTFVQFYPTLIEAAKKQGTYKEKER